MIVLYAVAVFLLTFALPIVSAAIDHWYFGSATPVIASLGRWFVFWAAGVRLMLAGIRQILRPQFTARQIFQITDGGVLPIVRELGFANFATGVVGTISIGYVSFVLPVAIAAAIFHGLAGVQHATIKERTSNQTIALASDLFVFAMLAVYAGFALLS